MPFLDFLSQPSVDAISSIAVSIVLFVLGFYLNKRGTRKKLTYATPRHPTYTTYVRGEPRYYYRYSPDNAITKLITLENSGSAVIGEEDYAGPFRFGLTYSYFGRLKEVVGIVKVHPMLTGKVQIVPPDEIEVSPFMLNPGEKVWIEVKAKVEQDFPYQKDFPYPEYMKVEPRNLRLRGGRATPARGPLLPQLKLTWQQYVAGAGIAIAIVVFIYGMKKLVWVLVP